MRPGSLPCIPWLILLWAFLTTEYTEYTEERLHDQSVLGCGQRPPCVCSINPLGYPGKGPMRPVARKHGSTVPAAVRTKPVGPRHAGGKAKCPRHAGGGRSRPDPHSRHARQGQMPLAMLGAGGPGANAASGTLKGRLSSHMGLGRTELACDLAHPCGVGGRQRPRVSVTFRRRPPPDVN